MEIKHTIIKIFINLDFHIITYVHIQLILMEKLKVILLFEHSFSS